MTHDTDALVSELISNTIKYCQSHTPTIQAERLGPFRASEKALLDAIARLIRERDEGNTLAAEMFELVMAHTFAERSDFQDGFTLEDVRILFEQHNDAFDEQQKRAETAETALSAARAELAECRNKALEEAAKMVDGMYKGLAHNTLYRDLANEISPRIRSLKAEA